MNLLLTNPLKQPGTILTFILLIQIIILRNAKEKHREILLDNSLHSIIVNTIANNVEPVDYIKCICKFAKYCNVYGNVL